MLSVRPDQAATVASVRKLRQPPVLVAALKPMPIRIAALVCVAKAVAAMTKPALRSVLAAAARKLRSTVQLMSALRI